MSSFVVRQLVAMVGFGGVAVLVGMPVRAQQVVLTPGGMQMVPQSVPQVVEPVRARTMEELFKDLPAPSGPKMTMEELMKNAPRAEGAENLPDFWTKPGAPIVDKPSDYIQRTGSLTPSDTLPQVISVISVEATVIPGLDPRDVVIGDSNIRYADILKLNKPDPQPVQPYTEIPSDATRLMTLSVQMPIAEVANVNQGISASTLTSTNILAPSAAIQDMPAVTASINTTNANSVKNLPNIQYKSSSRQSPMTYTSPAYFEKSSRDTNDSPLSKSRIFP
jgi:hypothetical protein